MKIRKLLLTLVVAGIALATVVAGAVALSQGDDSPVPAADHAPTAAAEPTGGLADVLSTLAKAPVTLPGGYDYGLLARNGGNLAAARRARTTEAGGTIYLVPSTRGACLTSTPLLEGGCFDAATLKTEVTAASVICAPMLATGKIEVYGTAPDGIDAVVISHSDGSSTSVPVIGNVYVYDAPRNGPQPLLVGWTENGSARQVSANVPADYQKGRCLKPSDLQGSEDAQPKSDDGPRAVDAAKAQRDLDAAAARQP